MSADEQRCGYVALVGRPNVGKSTLLNRLLGQKVSITTSKPQTTRHNILGISTRDQVQIVYVDTPGIHLRADKALNRYLNRAANAALGFADAAVMVVEALRWTAEDQTVLKRLSGFSGPVVLAVNKVDRISDKGRLLPFLAEVAGQREFAQALPLSARKGTNVAELEGVLGALMPQSEFAFPADQVTNVSVRFLMSELLREQLTRTLRDELPYALTVEIEAFEEQTGKARVSAVVWVERASQKSIVIGSGGERLKGIGRLARLDMERELGKPVFLETWVKVREGWSEDQQALNSLGFRD